MSICLGIFRMWIFRIAKNAKCAVFSPMQGIICDLALFYDFLESANRRS
ncbi:MAG: hypothetical protein FWG65_09970 [Turicibacter sp.]|nr:hypothetical protein [Turicibacter sp.]